MKNKTRITNENNLRIKDDEFIERLNKLFDKFSIANTSKNSFLVHLLKIGADTYEKQLKDSWAIKNETTTLLDALHEHTKRMNFFIKFSKPFIKNTYANNEINQTLLLRIYHYIIDGMEDLERATFFKDIQKHDTLPPKLLEEKERLKDYYEKRVD